MSIANSSNKNIYPSRCRNQHIWCNFCTSSCWPRNTLPTCIVWVSLCKLWENTEADSLTLKTQIQLTAPPSTLGEIAGVGLEDYFTCWLVIKSCADGFYGRSCSVLPVLKELHGKNLEWGNKGPVGRINCPSGIKLFLKWLNDLKMILQSFITIFLLSHCLGKTLYTKSNVAADCVYWQ